MNKLLLTLSFLISITYLTSQSWALPDCPKTGYMHNCYGTYISSREKYVGEFQNNEYNGQGKYYHLANDEQKGYIHFGEYKDGNRHGQGLEKFPDGSKYVGEFKDNKSHGQGTFSFVGGDKYVGEFKDGQRTGEGTYTYAGGKVKEGIWKNDKFMYAKKLIPTSSSNSKIEGYKSFCSEIGFTPGTEKFGECVVEVMKKGQRARDTECVLCNCECYSLMTVNAELNHSHFFSYLQKITC